MIVAALSLLVALFFGLWRHERGRRVVLQLVADEAARQAHQYRNALQKADAALSEIAEAGDRVVYTTRELIKEIDNKSRKL